MKLSLPVALRWLRTLRLPRLPTLALGFAALVSAISTYVVLTKIEHAYLDHRWVMLTLVSVNSLLMLALLTMVIRKILSLWKAFKLEAAGSRLQKRIIIMFSLGATVPSVLVSVLAGYLFYFGIQGWFDSKVSTALDESTAVAEAYLKEHVQVIRTDLLAIANEINQQEPIIVQSPEMFSKFISSQVAQRSLTEAVVFQPGRVMARSQLSFSLTFEQRIPPEIQRRLDNGEIVVVADDAYDQVKALTRLGDNIGAYLLVARFIDPKVIGHVERTRGAVSEYQTLESHVADLQLNFLSMFLLVGLLLLLASLWYGLLFAGDFIRPISELYAAAERVRSGDLTTQVPENKSKDELAVLGRAFNRMIRQIDTQQRELVTAQRYAAWSDVARRIAHEIKNPLTPIQLATERLRRKYGKNLEGEDKENFDKYIDMISRHVTDIRNMVDEFASFARMPAPQLQTADLRTIIEAAAFSEDCRHEGLDITLHLPTTPVTMLLDESQMGRALGNILKNAREAIQCAEPQPAHPEITIRLFPQGTEWELRIEDNGPGFPLDLLPRLTEPYVTTRQKGTGLGMAIVKKIIEDHKGRLTLENCEEGGARVKIIFQTAKA